MSFCGIAKISLKILVDNESLEFWHLDRRYHFDSSVQVTRHPVGAAHVNLRVTAVFEVVNAAMFQQSSDNASNPDVFRQSGNARPQGTYSTYDQIDLDAGLRRFVERV